MRGCPWKNKGNPFFCIRVADNPTRVQAKSPIEALKPYPDKAKSWHLGPFLSVFIHSEVSECSICYITVIREFPIIWYSLLQTIGVSRKWEYMLFQVFGISRRSYFDCLHWSGFSERVILFISINRKLPKGCIFHFYVSGISRIHENSRIIPSGISRRVVSVYYIASEDSE